MWLIAAAAVAAAGGSAASARNRGMVSRSLPTTTWCGGGRLHSLRYNVTTFDDGHFYDIDSDLDDLESVSCNNDGTRTKLVFHDEINAEKYAVEFRLSDSYLIGGKKWGCRNTPKHSNATSGMVRRVVDVQTDGQALEVRTAFSKYDEVYQQADIEYSSQPHAGKCDGDDFDKTVCIGFNTDCKNGATQPLPIYQNQFLDITCSDCFLGYESDVFVTIEIDEWTLKKLAVGYKNMTMSGALVLTATAQAQWSNGVDKVLNIAQDVTLVDFHVGPIPFIITLDIPVDITASISFEATATAIFGAMSTWYIGDHYTSWDPDNHWQHVTPKPSLLWSAKVENASASFDATATFAVSPTLAMHIDSIFTYRASMVPTLTGEVKGDTTSKQVCASLSYDLAITANTELEIAIPFANIDDDWVWTKTIYDSGTVPIAQKCTAPVNASLLQ
eukprot:m.465312 g.465312  ORF g.465312 m.465312 type:complete len:444 (-) comp24094_c0_seq1:101-1432(-)